MAPWPCLESKGKRQQTEMNTTSLSQERFDSLLKWLDPDRDRAGEKYKAIRLRLQKMFVVRGCVEIEDLADETITRVASHMGDLGEYSGDPARYFYGIAQKVHLEYLRRPSSQIVRAEPESMLSTDIRRELSCVEKCLEQLSATNREMILRYYQKRAKVEARKALAEELGIPLNALRIRAHRIRVALQDCVHGCLERSLELEP